MKTPHRIMFDALSRDEYAGYCRNVTVDIIIQLLNAMTNGNSPDCILTSSFVFSETPEGSDYWWDIANKLSHPLHL